MKKFLLILAFAAMTLSASAQTAYQTVIPDIPGYKTLKCDFHIHTVFSDGQVMPGVRVDEAVREGLDVIAITDHIEYRPNHRSGLMSSDFNESYKRAKSAASTRDLIVIHGSEITRGMPPGHWNAIFLEDANKLETPDWEEAFAEAKKQGAFIFWNHPGWASQQPNETLFMPEHQKLFDQGYMMGIEITNHSCGDYYPEAHQWCLDKNLAMIGNTDIHSPIGAEVDFTRGEHRDMTLVFAKEKTAESLKEALMARRTAVYAGESVYGRAEFLEPLFESILGMKVVGVSKNAVTIEITNKSSLILYMDKGEGSTDLMYPRQSKIRPYETVRCRVQTVSGAEFASDEIALSLIVKNFHTEVGQGMPYVLKVPVK